MYSSTDIAEDCQNKCKMKSFTDGTPSHRHCCPQGSQPQPSLPHFEAVEAVTTSKIIIPSLAWIPHRC